MGLMKMKTVIKPATKERQGKNPFTGETITIKAKPASRKVRVRALKTLNNML
jgi:nucleoid DNA-binding protein